jgi:hypothetical protein
VYKKSKDKTECKQLKQKELKRQRKNKDKYFANLKGRENSQWCNLLKLRELQCAKRSHGARNKLLPMEIAVLSSSLCFPTTAPENSLH